MIHYLKAIWWDGMKTWNEILYVSTDFQKVKKIKSQQENKYAPLIERKKEINKIFKATPHNEWTNELCEESLELQVFEDFYELTIESFELDVLDDFI